MLYLHHMSDRQPSIAEKYRPLLEEKRGSEREMRGLADEYLDRRRKGELLIGSALDRVDMAPEDERELLSQELVLIATDAERAVDGDEVAEERVRASMEGFLRHLSGRRARRGMKMVADANGEVEAALELLQEIRTARRGMIETLREEISKSGDIEAAQECCKLLEEEIGAARASKDIESERIAAASLEIVRRLAEPEEVAEEENEAAVEFVETLVTNGDIEFGDTEWAIRALRRHLAASTATDQVSDAIRTTLKEYKERNRTKPVNKRDIDPRGHFTGRFN